MSLFLRTAAACLVGTSIGVFGSQYVWTYVLYPWLEMRHARKRIEHTFGETKRHRRAIHRQNRRNG